MIAWLSSHWPVILMILVGIREFFDVLGRLFPKLSAPAGAFDALVAGIQSLSSAQSPAPPSAQPPADAPKA